MKKPFVFPDVLNGKKRYAFGSPMPSRNFSSANYRYGFNGKEKDNEIKGEGNSLDFGGRIYDSRLGRWLSIDPKSKLFAGQSPYNFAVNMPIIAVDKDGEIIEIMVGKTKVQYEPGKTFPKAFTRNKAFNETVKMLEVIEKSLGNKFNKVLETDKVLVLVIDTKKPSKENTGQNWHYYPDEHMRNGELGNSINVDPRNATEFTIDGKSGYHSATTNLAHEIGHFYLDAYPGERDKKTGSDQHPLIKANFENPTIDYINNNLGGNEDKRTSPKSEVGYDYISKTPFTTQPDTKTESGKVIGKKLEGDKK